MFQLAYRMNNKSYPRFIGRVEGYKQKPAQSLPITSWLSLRLFVLLEDNRIEETKQMTNKQKSRSQTSFHITG